jgi:hypothetical protein
MPALEATSKSRATGPEKQVTKGCRDLASALIFGKVYHSGGTSPFKEC